MLRALYTAATGMQAQQINIDTIANNIANVNTTGFKQGRAEFQDLLYQNIRPAGTASSTFHRLSGRTCSLVWVPARSQPTGIYSQGDFRQTGNPLDLVIEGKGFLPGAPAQRRNRVHARRLLPSERRRRDGRQPMEIRWSRRSRFQPTLRTIVIGKDGTVSVTQAGRARRNRSARSRSPTFRIRPGLNAIGRQPLFGFDALPATRLPDPWRKRSRTINQGFLEQSNVNVVEEMVNMIIAQRAYEVNSKAVRVADDMLSQINNLVR